MVGIGYLGNIEVLWNDS